MNTKQKETKMSTRETNCKWYEEGEDCLNFDEEKGCTVNCEYFNPKDDKLPPEVEEKVDSKIKKIEEDKKDINLKISGLAKFNKKYEFLVLKRMIFEIQSISPKKIILKFKTKLNESDKLTDGCYIFTDKEDEPLIPHKVFNKFHNNTKKAQKSEKKGV